jgi:di/tricarboxylate transporter
MIIALVTTAVGSFASNAACANILLPIVGAVAQNSAMINPWRLMFPACFVTSCCFLLPVRTPPNLIAYGYGRFFMKDMLVHGAVFTVASLFMVIGMCDLLMPPVFNVREFPDWGRHVA